MFSPLLLIVIGFSIGTFGTLVGAGGGFILIPVLLLMAPTYPPEKLTALSLVVIFFNSLSGTIAYARKKRIDYKAGLIFAAASVPGAILGATVIQEIPRQTFDPIFGTVLLVVAIYLFFRPLGKKLPPSDHTPPKPFLLNNRFIPMGISLSVGVGFLSSLLGIGGGVVHVPTMVNFLGFPVHYATATSHFVMVFMTGIGTLTHLYHGDLHGMETEILCLAPAVIIGAQLGAYLSEKIKGDVIIRALSVALAIVGLRLLFA